MNGVDNPARYRRKGLVFHIMYGRALGATDEETIAWRTLGARFINGDLAPENMPMTLGALRELRSRETAT